MRVVFLGNAPWSVPCLEAVAGSAHAVRLVATRAPKPAGRGGRPTPTPVAGAARSLGLPLMEVETVKRGPGFDAIADARPDVLAVVAYGEILPKALLDLPAVAPVNVHFSMLPQFRGAAPVQRALLEGAAVTGVTTMRMDEGMDTGPLLLQAEEPIRADDSTGSLGARLAVAGGRLLVETLDRLEAGTLQERAQNDDRATYAPKLKRQDRVIDWEQEAARIVRLVRALAPDPAAVTTYRGRNLKVFRAIRLAPSPNAGAESGTVTMASKEGFAVQAGDGPVLLQELAPEGRNRMSGAEFVRGYRPEHGERLG